MDCGEKLLEGNYVELTDFKSIRKLPKERDYPPNAPYAVYLYGVWHPERGWLYIGIARNSLRERWANHPHLNDTVSLRCRLYWILCTHFPPTQCEIKAIQTFKPIWVGMFTYASPGNQKI